MSLYTQSASPSPLALFGLEVRFRHIEDTMKKEQQLRRQSIKKGHRAGMNKHNL